MDIYTKEGFITNQKLFIEAKIKEFQNARGHLVIFDRGPEDIEFLYTTVSESDRNGLGY
ncbi:hypothetical protein bcere0022_28240 [Bacillus cereus Rock3-44]|nr:hypothetical protein bcere0022_28240 [Bacillus cereus Rock3-44]